MSWEQGKVWSCVSTCVLRYSEDSIDSFLIVLLSSAYFSSVFWDSFSLNAVQRFKHLEIKHIEVNRQSNHDIYNISYALYFNIRKHVCDWQTSNPVVLAKRVWNKRRNTTRDLCVWGGEGGGGVVFLGYLTTCIYVLFLRQRSTVLAEKYYTVHRFYNMVNCSSQVPCRNFYNWENAWFSLDFKL